jgi:hypothetical protein
MQITFIDLFDICYQIMILWIKYILVIYELTAIKIYVTHLWFFAGIRQIFTDFL